MNFLTNLLDAILSTIAAKDHGLTNDANIMNYFRAEYKKDPQGAYEYWLSNGKDRYTFG